MKVLVAVDLQNDFINGALGTAEAAAMLPRAERKIRSFEGLVLFTRDTHTEDYLNTREGKALPVPHCIRGSHGWQLAARLLPYASEIIDKPTFGSTALGERLRALNEDAPYHPHRTLHRYLRHQQRPAAAGLPAGSSHPGGCRLLRRGHPGKPPHGAGRHARLPDHYRKRTVYISPCRERGLCPSRARPSFSPAQSTKGDPQ